MTEKTNKGLHNKYRIERVDGEPINPNNEYFVLKVAGEGDFEHIRACRRAIIKYAEEIAEFLPDLSTDIFNRYGYDT